MAKGTRNPIYFEDRAIKEELEDIDSLEPAYAMKLQCRLCELMVEIKQHEKQLKENHKNTFRKNAVKKNKESYYAELSDLMAFKHLLTNREFTRRHPAGTVKQWLTRVNKGDLPRIAIDILKKEGYKVLQERKWAKPNSVKYK